MGNLPETNGDMTTRSAVSAIDVLHAIEPVRPVLREVLAAHGPDPIGHYVQGFAEQRERTTAQPADDLIRAIRSLTAETLGEERAQAVEATLHESHDILTADHLGPINLNITTQGDIVYAASKSPDQTAVVLAFGDVPLNNLNYARGVKLARGTKTNLFPAKNSEMMVSVAPRVSMDMIAKGRTQVADQLAKKEISEAEAQAQRLLLDLYASAQVQAQPDFAHQLTVINDYLWNAMFDEDARGEMPSMTFLEMETVVARLLEADFQQDHAPLTQMLFGDPLLRANLIARLDGKNINGHYVEGQYGCWDTKKLANVVADNPRSWPKGERDERAKARRQEMSGAGTMFFWGVDDDGRRVNLMLTDDQSQLVGVDDSGNDIRIDFTPGGIRKALRDKKVIPSLFTSFTSVSLLRGMKCFGGFMQTDYLTNFREGVADALDQTAQTMQGQRRSQMRQQYQEWTRAIRNVHTENYSTGMTFAVARYDDGSVQPAGAMEMIAKGGLTRSDLARIRQMTVQEANLMGVLGQYATVFPEGKRDPRIMAMTPRTIADELGGKLIDIPLPI